MYSRYLKAHPDTPQIGQDGLKLHCDNSAQIGWQDVFVSTEEILARVLDNEQKKDNSKTGKVRKWLEKMTAFFKGLLQIIKIVSEVSYLRFSSLTVKALTNISILGTVAQGLIIIYGVFRSFAEAINNDSSLIRHQQRQRPFLSS